jgi:hypothetical protein
MRLTDLVRSPPLLLLAALIESFVILRIEGPCTVPVEMGTSISMKHSNSVFLLASPANPMALQCSFVVPINNEGAMLLATSFFTSQSNVILRFLSKIGN